MSYMIELQGKPLCVFNYRGARVHQWGRSVPACYGSLYSASVELFSIPEQAQRFIDSARVFCNGAVIREVNHA